MRMNRAVLASPRNETRSTECPGMGNLRETNREDVMTVAEQPAFALPKQVQARVAAAEARTQFKRVHADPAVPVVADPAPVQPEASAPAATPPANDADYWKARFLTVDGLLKKRTDEYKERLASRDAQIRVLQDQIAATARTARIESIDPAQYMPANVIDEMGGIDVARHSLKGAAKLIEELNTPAPAAPPAPEPIEDDEPEYLRILGFMVPNWKQINADPRFLDWLAANGDARQKELDGYARAEDAQSIALLFGAFQTSLTAPRTPPLSPAPRAAAHAENPAPPQRRPTNDLPALTGAYIKEMYSKIGRGQLTEQQAQEFRQRLITERGTVNP